MVDHYGVAKVLTLMKAYRDDYAGPNLDALTHGSYARCSG